MTFNNKLIKELRKFNCENKHDDFVDYNKYAYSEAIKYQKIGIFKSFVNWCKNLFVKIKKFLMGK